jgi:hypothetical protein
MQSLHLLFIFECVMCHHLAYLALSLKGVCVVSSPVLHSSSAHIRIPLYLPIWRKNDVKLLNFFLICDPAV